ncbi:MAG: exodeoxyribonuclease VII large subunit, partial [Candidatus Omnitrophica bacterium]|nr:exodeoxyribonuclease VII large subunit [Candidatus Omnitrophota bacterium]
MPEDVFTVSQINTYIKGVINAAFPQPLWICGEIQGYNRSKGKNHIFFELVEKDKRLDSITAKIGLVIFANRKAQIDHILKKSENGFELKDDIEVKFQCRMDFYPPHGAMRLIVEAIDPTYTLGKLAQQRQKIIAELRKKGLLDKNKELSLPRIALNIGLITSDDSAAYNDFVSELQRSGYGFQVFLRNASMQGPKTEGDVTRAIATLEAMQELDVIVITRGGGSIADLSDFDNKLIAEKIAECRLPVLSGIGHEINNTITDMAAHTFAKTPTAIAQYLVLLVKDYLNDMDSKFDYILTESQDRFREERGHLKDLAVQLQQSTTQFLKEY